jgi:hypothetical protein
MLSQIDYPNPFTNKKLIGRKIPNSAFARIAMLPLIMQGLPSQKLTNANCSAMVRGDFASGTQLHTFT